MRTRAFLDKFIYSIFFSRAWKARSDGSYVRRSWVQHPVLTRSEITTTGWPPVLVTAWEVLARCVLVLAPTGNGGCYQNSLRAGVVSYFWVLESNWREVHLKDLLRILRTHRSMSHFTFLLFFLRSRHLIIFTREGRGRSFFSSQKHRLCFFGNY